MLTHGLGVTTQMRIQEALALLNLTWHDRQNVAVIKRAWKQTIFDVHPDRCARTDANEHAQKVNEAKDCLLHQSDNSVSFESIIEELEKKQREAKLEREKLERQKAANTQAREEEIRRPTKVKDQRKHETDKKEAVNRQWANHMKEADEFYERMMQARRERYAKNRRKRADGSRVHRKLESYSDGLTLVNEMKDFFKTGFETKNEHVFMSDVVELWVRSRKQTSDLEKRLFHRHAKKLMAATWPTARYTKHSNKWSFYGLAAKHE